MLKSIRQAKPRAAYDVANEGDARGKCESPGIHTRGMNEHKVMFPASLSFRYENFNSHILPGKFPVLQNYKCSWEYSTPGVMSLCLWAPPA